MTFALAALVYFLGLLLWINLLDLGSAPSNVAHRFPIVLVLACGSAFVLSLSGVMLWIGDFAQTRVNARKGVQRVGPDTSTDFSRSAVAADVAMVALRFTLVLPMFALLIITIVRIVRLLFSSDPIVARELAKIIPLDAVIALLLLLFVLFARVPWLVHESPDGDGAHPDA
ncbi:MAG: hypothetical protein KIT54_06220 [Phycisphaeraceae bacterium]|nr:hypothetical protein [Phycisphaeraceae bacterium]